MRLLVLGASGGCGRWVTQLAAARGHRVTALLRAASTFRPPEGVRDVRGSVLDPAVIAPLLADADAAICCLGLRRASALPWSRLLSPPDLVEQVARIVAAEPAAHGLRRFVWISAGGVGDSRAQATAPVRGLIRAGHVGTAYRDLERAEPVLQASPVPSLAVRPVTLLPGAPTGCAAPVERYGLLSVIRRGDVAAWMLDAADGTAPFAGDRVLLGRR